MNFSRFFLVAGVFLTFLSVSEAQVDRKQVPAESAAAKSNGVCDSTMPASPTVKAGRRGQTAESSKKRKMDAIISAARSRTSALIAREAGKLQQLLAPDFVYTNASGKVFDRQSYIQNYALNESVSWTSQALSEVCVVFSADVAVLTAVTHDVARFGDYPLDARFRTTQIYRRSAGGWIYLAGHTSNLEQ